MACECCLRQPGFTLIADADAGAGHRREHGDFQPVVNTVWCFARFRSRMPERIMIWLANLGKDGAV